MKIVRSFLCILFINILFCCSDGKHQEKIHIQNSKYLSQIQLSSFVNQTKSYELAQKQFEVPFKNLQFNKVIAYDFDGDEEKYPTVIDEKTKLFNPVVLRQKELNSLQIENVISFLTNNKTYGEGTAACFIPHFAILFYQDNTLVYEVDICLDCNYLQATTKIPAAYTKKMELEDGIFIDLIGFSNKGKVEIINLCKELGLDYANYK